MNWQNLFRSSNDQTQRDFVAKCLRRLLKKNILSYKQFTTIENVIECGDLSARDIMLPRVDVVAIDIHTTSKNLLKTVVQANHSRFPVYDKNIDDIKGVLHIKDIFNYSFEKIQKGNRDLAIKQHISKPFFIPEARRIFDILKDFQQRHMQMAIVVDEYGGFSGIVTMEDILEEIIGDIKDESDDELDAVIQTSTNSFSIDARADLETLNEKTGLALESQKAETLGGYLINLLGYVPKLGEVITQDHLVFKIKTKRGNSLIRISLKVTPPEEQKPASARESVAKITKEKIFSKK